MKTRNWEEETAGDMEMEPDELECTVWQMLAGVKDPQLLADVCTALGVEVTPDYHGKRNLLYKLLMGHLHSAAVQESEDGGLSTYLAIKSLLDLFVLSEQKTVQSNALPTVLPRDGIGRTPLSSTPKGRGRGRGSVPSHISKLHPVGGLSRNL